MFDASTPLAFVDLETTGLSPGRDRIVEIGVVTVDSDRVEEWSSLVNPGRRVAGFTREFTGITDDMLADAPRFGELAADLRRRLDGRVFLAHNARFDHGFLKSEFARLGIGFDPAVVCTAMLSRKFYRGCGPHNLDALVARHGLAAETRHRALPDARAIRGFWLALQRDFGADAVAWTAQNLRRVPALPVHLDPALIDRLPESAGVCVFHGADGRPLQIARAANLKRHVMDYFRVDRGSARAAKLAQAVRDITCHPAAGPLGARLLEVALKKRLFPEKSPPAAAATFLRLLPAAECAAEFLSVGEGWPEGDDLFGLYRSERHARSALRRLADRHRICHALLGIARGAGPSGSERLQHIGRLVSAAAPLKLPRWPYPGPVVVREGREVHLLDRWQYLGTATTEAEVHALLEARRPPVDAEVFRLLAKNLWRLRPRAVVPDPRGTRPAPVPALQPGDLVEVANGRSPTRCAE